MSTVQQVAEGAWVLREANAGARRIDEGLGGLHLEECQADEFRQAATRGVPLVLGGLRSERESATRGTDCCRPQDHAGATHDGHE